ncbi:probable arginine--tRNA ligase, mitochondrial [Dermacentor silvarum]|uniref:probable arginine--tRNA ligase, mitochondrial n=1 Tax=Dermacentor silvarum TaxID=543639 RepID=UPI0021007C8D|nr:probable arginine--tRNA ligase, mitochondrial [Dermacentor silvarum]
MVSALRRKIAEQICLSATRLARCRDAAEFSAHRFLPLVKLKIDKSCSVPFLVVSESDLGGALGIGSEEFRGPLKTDLENVLSQALVFEAGELAMPIDRASFLQESLCSAGCAPRLVPSQRIVVDFSSPNVAKPFHVGHLRSTVLGHSLCNLLSFAGHHVTRLNYLGDWGTQCGLLIAGFNKYGNNEELTKDPLKHLLSVYVAANAEAEKNPAFRAEALQHFTDLEAGQQEVLDQWQRWRQLSLDGYGQQYKRLGVSFDVLDAESRHSHAALDLLERLRAEEKLTSRGDGVLGIECQEFVPLARSSGASLYLTRDVVAALERKERYDFDWAYYVVDRSQAEHFRRLALVLEQLGVEWSDRVQHVPFGRIRGISSRKGIGEGMLLDDLLNEAVHRARQSMEQAPMPPPQSLPMTSEMRGAPVRAGAEKRVMQQLGSSLALISGHAAPSNSTAEKSACGLRDQKHGVLGSAAVVVNFLRGRRNRDITFDWHQALHAAGDSGVSLQYAHARLCSLEEKAGLPVETEAAVDLLQEPCALALAVQVARFEEVVCSAVDQLEPCIVAQYLFALSHAIGRATKELPVKNQGLFVAKARLLLFHASRVTLAQGMRLLGVEPLTAM